MPLTGKTNSPAQPEPQFYLDENFPPQVAKALAMVGYRITTPGEQKQEGVKDPALIPWLAARGMCWITKDDEARSRHQKELVTNSLSVVWVRGVDRAKKGITPKMLHRMLTDKLDEIAAQLARRRSPLYFLLYMNGDRPALKSSSDISAVGDLASPKGRRPSRQHGVL